MKRIVVTGAAGLLGFHSSAHLHATNCAAVFRGRPAPYDLQRLDRAGFESDATLREALRGADIVLHFAGVNRGDPAEVEAANPAIAQRLVRACREVRAEPHFVYANSIHVGSETPYGRGKASAARILAAADGGFTDLVLAHVFGEGARPYYNNVTATLIDRILKNDPPALNPEGQVRLLHAGDAVDTAIHAALTGQTGQIAPKGKTMLVSDLYTRLLAFHQSYVANIYPPLIDDLDLALFNTYRAATYPHGWPRPLKVNNDTRGSLFEAVKGGSGGQIFLSTTHPGITRGNHFHLSKVERFLVLKGEAVIRIRRVLSDNVWEFRVSGAVPAPVDMPTMHTHSIENVGDGELLTLFWTNKLFDPQDPDTFADKVLA